MTRTWTVIIGALLVSQCHIAAVEFERHSFDAPQSIWSVTAVDWNDNGELDLVGMGETQVYVWLAPDWRRITVANFHDGKMLYCVPWDADGDGKLDLVVGRFRNPWFDYRKSREAGKSVNKPIGPDFTLGWIKNTGCEKGHFPFHVLDRQLNGIHGLLTGDIDGDGVTDLVANSILGPHFANSIVWYPGTQGIRKETAKRQLITHGRAVGRPHYLDVADLNGNGQNEVLLGASAGGTFTRWQRNSTVPQEWTRYTIANEAGATNIRAADVNGNGRLDVVTSNGHGQGVHWFESPDWVKHSIDPELKDAHALDVADLSGNGHSDVASASYTTGQVVWYENDGRGAFRRNLIDHGRGQESYDLKIIDLDGDNRPDILLAGRESKNVVWYRNVSEKPKSPADSLPPHIKRLTWFGERPDWRHDGKRFIFLNKVFGNVYECDLATGRIYPLTDHYTHHGYTRALYLPNGDILLVGPSKTYDRTDKEDRRKARHDHGVISVLDRSLTKPPVSLGVECDEGPAVSRKSNRLAWTHGAQDKISIGQIEYTDGKPRLTKVRQIIDASQFPGPARIIETQNFVPGDEDKLTLTGYQLAKTNNTETFLFDLGTGELANMSKSPETYDEVEGIFPDGKYTTVEHGSSRDRPWPMVDIYKLALDGSGKRERLTHFSDTPGWKATQSVISDDGRFMLFQIGKSGTEAGQGYGVFLYDFQKANER